MIKGIFFVNFVVDYLNFKIPNMKGLGWFNLIFIIVRDLLMKQETDLEETFMLQEIL